MKLKIDRRKYKKRMLAFWISIVLMSFAPLMVVVMNIIESNPFDAEKIGILSGLLFLLFFPVILVIFYSRLKRRREFVMVFEKGMFTNYSRPFAKPVSVKIEEIESIRSWGNGKINQYKIVTTRDQSNQSELMNQLKGNHTYVTDYLVDSEELNNLMLMIQKEREKIV